MLFEKTTQGRYQQLACGAHHGHPRRDPRVVAADEKDKGPADNHFVNKRVKNASHHGDLPVFSCPVSIHPVGACRHRKKYQPAPVQGASSGGTGLRRLRDADHQEENDRQDESQRG